MEINVLKIYNEDDYVAIGGSHMRNRGKNQFKGISRISKCFAHLATTNVRHFLFDTTKDSSKYLEKRILSN